MAEKEGYKYYPVEVDLNKLYDWKKRDDEDGKNGVKVRVNNKDIAVFKFGDGVIATDAVCPHAPTHLMVHPTVCAVGCEGVHVCNLVSVVWLMADGWWCGVL